MEYMIHVRPNEKPVKTEFKKSIITEHPYAIEIPARHSGANYRRGLICFCLTDDETDIKKRVKDRLVEYYIFYCERDNNWDGYEGLDIYVSNNIMSELSS